LQKKPKKARIEERSTLTDDLDKEIANFKKNGIGVWAIAWEENGGDSLTPDLSPPVVNAIESSG
jgi:hypothetical protein